MLDELYELCSQCVGNGWYVIGEYDAPEQVQCDNCCGIGYIPSYWMDIDSAPTDGTWILGFEYEPREMFFGLPEHTGNIVPTWFNSSGYPCQPTHWRPKFPSPIKKE